MSTMQNGPLEGVRVVEFGQYIAVPAATQIMADLGADVVKVEAPRGDQARSIGTFGAGMMRAYNRGKRSVELDLRRASDRQLARDLVCHADIVVQNMRPGALERFELTYHDLVVDNPGLVHVSVTGYAPGTPSAARPGLDIAGQAESGLMSVTGQADGDPQRVGFPVVDTAASYAVVQAGLAGLFRRERQGVGTSAHVSLLDVAVHMQAMMWGEWSVTGEAPSRTGNGQPTVAPAADLIHTKDGMVVVSAYTAPRFKILAETLGKPELVHDPRFLDNTCRVENREALLDEIEEVLGILATDEVIELLSAAGVVVAHVRTYDEVAASPDITEGDLLVTGRDDDGSFRVPGLPYTIEGFRPPQDRRIPRIGEHTDDERARLRQSEQARGRW